MKILFEQVRSTAILPTKNDEDSGYDFYLDTNAFRDFELSDLIPKDCTEVGYYDWVKQSAANNRVIPITVIYGNSLVIKPGVRVKIPLGWKVRLEHPTFFLNALDSSGEAFELPMNSELQLRTKSGRGHKDGLVITLGIGTVDSLYPDELFASVHNISHDIVTIKHNEKFCQGVPSLVIRTEITQVDSIEFSGQRTGGFGSTGAFADEPTQIEAPELPIPTESSPVMCFLFQGNPCVEYESTLTSYPEMAG